MKTGGEMDMFVRVASVVALVVGLFIALCSWQAQNIAELQAQAQASPVGPGTGAVFWSTPTVPIVERELGLAFGFGLSFLGAFGLYALSRAPGPPAA